MNTPERDGAAAMRLEAENSEQPDANGALGGPRALAGRHAFLATDQGPGFLELSFARRASTRGCDGASSWLIGREAEIQDIIYTLLSHRFVTLVGPAGIGKTTAAIGVAEDLQSQFNSAAYFVDLSNLGDAESIPGAVAFAVGHPPGAGEPTVDITRRLSSGPALLILDGCERMIEKAAAFAKHLYDTAPHVLVLCTSRQPLWLEHEHQFRLGPLKTPPEGSGLSAADALRYGAVALFMDRASSSGLAASLCDADVPLVVNICERLAGVPLALELAGSRVGTYGLRGTATLLDNRFRLLWLSRRNAVPGFQTLQAMIDWSYNLLTGSEQFVLARLAVFGVPFSLAAAQAVVASELAHEADVARALISLLDKSLLAAVFVDGQRLYRLLDLLQTYAEGKFAAVADRADVLERHAGYHAAPRKACAAQTRLGPQIDVADPGLSLSIP